MQLCKRSARILTFGSWIMVECLPGISCISSSGTVRLLQPGAGSSAPVNLSVALKNVIRHGQYRLERARIR